MKKFFLMLAVAASAMTASAQEPKSGFADAKFWDNWYLGANLGVMSKATDQAVLKNMNPEITEFPTVEVVVDNELIKQEIEDIQKSIAKTLQVYLHNNQIQITVRVAEQTEHVKILSRREQFEQMAEKNAAVAKLQQAFDLELA